MHIAPKAGKSEGLLTIYYEGTGGTTYAKSAAFVDLLVNLLDTRIGILTTEEEFCMGDFKVLNFAAEYTR